MTKPVTPPDETTLQSCLRALPKIDGLVRRASERASALPTWVLTAVVRGAVDETRAEVRSGALRDPDAVVLRASTLVEEGVSALTRPSLRRVHNATGVVLHTNLGRSPLGPSVVDAMVDVALGYSTLEMDIVARKRGSRLVHVEGLLRVLTGAEAALVVNNCAAAVLLLLDTFCAGGEVVVSRGELVEVGGGFRVPEVMERARVRLREVGTTNKTRVADYATAIGPDTRALMKVHPSNFWLRGFTSRVEPHELVALGKPHGLPVFEDLGSGALVDLARWGLPHEPTARESIEAGIDVVTMSGDKLLGGPQAGIVVGSRARIQSMARNPLIRALRCDRVTLAALEATLRLYVEERYDEIPTLRMLAMSVDVVRERADALAGELRAGLGESWHVTLERGHGKVGGGALPGAKLPSWLVSLSHATLGETRIDEALRRADPPIVARVGEGAVRIDPRTIEDDTGKAIVRALASLA